MSPGPTNVAASVRERLTRRARARAENVQLLLTRYAIERLLFRLSLSPHRDRFVLKGAMLFSLWAPTPYRATGDLDLQPGEWVRVKSKEEIQALLTEEGTNRGLWFDREMMAFCGQVFRVRGRVNRIIDEPTGKVIELNSDWKSRA